MSRMQETLKEMRRTFSRPEDTTLKPLISRLADLRELKLSSNRLNSISVLLSNLPPALEYLNLVGNKFSGSFDFNKLPPNLKFLDLSYNLFSGSPDLTRLPPALHTLLLSRNQFSGTLTK